MPRPSILQVVVVLLLGAVGLVAVSAAYRARNGRDAAPQQPAPQQAPQSLAAPSKGALTFSVVHVRPGHRVALRSAPGARVIARVWWTTEYGSAATLAVAETRGPWLGLTSSDVPNGELGWVRAGNPALVVRSTPISLLIHLSRRTLELRNGRTVVRRATVGIGRNGSTTPTGRFSVTDELQGRSFGPYYGCCILALSGHQAHLPAGWLGGDRLAIHGTDSRRSIGRKASAGCLHVDAEVLRVLMRRVPLGTPVFIQA